MPKETNGLAKARSLTETLYSIMSIVVFIVTVLYFFFTVKTGLTTLDKEFHKHVKEDEKKFAQVVPAKQLEVEFRAITNTLIEIREQSRQDNIEIRKQLKDCQVEDKLFKDQLFEFMLEMKDN